MGKLPSRDIGMSKHLAARLFPHRGLGTFCVPTNQELLSRDVVERLSDSRPRAADMNVRWPEKPFGSSICNTQTQVKGRGAGEPDVRVSSEM